MKTSSFGLSFIEILIVVAITAIIASMGAIGLSQLQALFKLRSAADEIRALMQYGRELAIANKNQVTYRISLASGIVVLRSSLGEVSRYQSPSGITYQPESFTWHFTPLTGLLNDCSLPCVLSLSTVGNTETVIFQSNGLID